MVRLAVLSLVVLGMGSPRSLVAQETSDFLAVGEMAPDIQVAGATRHGTLSETVNLSELRGETVVLAFYFRARSGG